MQKIKNLVNTYINKDIIKNENNNLEFLTVNKKNKLYKIIKTKKEYRTKSDLETIYKEFQNLDYFKSLYEKNEDLILTYILKSIEFKEYKQNEIIFKSGEFGSHCYILLKGTIIFLTPPVNRLSSRNLVRNLGKVFINSQDLSLNKNDSSFIKNSTNNQSENSILSTLNEGCLFGEKELQDRIKRPYSAKCQTICLLGLISKNDYSIIFENSKKLETNDEIKFYSSIQVFNPFIDNIIDRLMSLFEKKFYRKGDVVVKQGSIFDKFYIIRKGQFEVIQSRENKHISDFDLNFYLKLNKKEERFTSSRLHELKGNYKEKEHFKLFILGIGQFFGDVEIKNKMNIYNNSFKCIIEKSELYECDVEKLLEILPKKIIDKIIEQASHREYILDQRITEIKNNKKNGDKFQKIILDKAYSSNDANVGNNKRNSEIERNNLQTQNQVLNTKNNSKSYKGEDILPTTTNNINTYANTESNNIFYNRIVHSQFLITGDKIQTRNNNFINSERIETNSSMTDKPICLTSKNFKVNKLYDKFMIEKENRNSIHSLIIPKFQNGLSLTNIKNDLTDKNISSLFNLNTDIGFYPSKNVKNVKNINFNKTKNKNKISLSYYTNNSEDNKNEMPKLTHKKSNSILYEQTKENFTKCLEMNKNFYLNNYPNMINSGIKDYFKDLQ